MSRRGGKQPQHQPSPAPSQSARGPDVAPARPQGAAPSSAPTDDLRQLTLQSPALSSPEATIFPDRPDFGTMGRSVKVRANHFLVQLADKELHHYDVSITPEIKSKKINRDVMSQLVQMYGVSDMNQRIPAFDGRKSLFTAGLLPFDSMQFVVKLVAKDEHGSSSGSTRNEREREFKVTIRYASNADLHHLRQFLRSLQPDNPQKTIQALDIVLRASPSEKYTVVGKSFFSPSLGKTGQLGDGIEYWRGYYQTLRPTQMGLSLNIAVSARPFYENILVTEFIAKRFEFNFSRRLSDQDRIKVERALRRVKVEVTTGNVTRSYIITGLSKDPLSELMFTLDDKETKTTTTVVQYFREKYNVGLKYLSLPALQAGNDAKPIYLPMELCKIAAGQRYSKKLNERQVSALLKATCQRPLDREKDIRGMAGRNNFNGDKLVREFGIGVVEELALCDARVLPPPRLQYHKTGKEEIVQPLMGQWNMINKKMYNAGEVQYWTCLNFSTQVNRQLTVEFCNKLINMCTSKGMVFNRTPLLPIRLDRPCQIEGALKRVYKQAGKGKLQLLIIILPTLQGSYAKIKRICETKLGIVSQCSRHENVLKLKNQYLENLALKINVKVGGCNTVLMDKIPHVTDGSLPTIIFGADVTHPQSGEDSSPSIAAVVASMDWPGVSKYRGIVSAQSPREEIILDLYKTYQDADKGVKPGGMIRELLKAFYKLNKASKPDNIIFYRDGVGEGQFSQVLLHEMQAIRKACASLEEGYLPKVTFLVVQKRHHTRFFPVDSDQTDGSGNILPGTVVDTHICHPSEFDFYLNSHAGMKGTSRPTHYHVLFDENNFTADELQTFTNNLCYTYARCTKSVSIVPPVYYAHLAAFRARCYIEGQTSGVDSGSGSRSTNVAVTLPAIVDNVKNVMYYC